ncbi:hypothetical protein Pcinc_011914 [Petrolisthes cinctipes]|uniref:Uncharacterized protein n=1 Tax=Petrolisthes cinctipes TaxID=88211 RepID=A0AAE1G1Q4_PETCI|nr:hypothetical protein Pcinc_011914 [Petrolisthes cinctipes]
MRTRYGRLTATRSGDGSAMDEMTERERWIYDNFIFLSPHIVRCPSRQTKKFPLVNVKGSEATPPPPSRPSTAMPEEERPGEMTLQ